ncbi:MAG TPA: spore germination protein GerW family protein [Pirellulales bacterium]|jgi:uncharacterized spore protein YtfJ
MIENGVDKTTEQRKTSFIERLAKRMGVAGSAKSVYGDPVEHNGVTVIPVAKVRWGFGGGAGRKPGKRGTGGGGGMHSVPVGYIELKDGESNFKPIHDPMNFVPLVAVGGFAGWMLLRALRKLIRK